MSTDRKLSVQDKLNLLTKKGTGHLPPPKPKTHYGIDSVISGEFCVTALGDVFYSEQKYLTDYHHGVSPIHPPHPEVPRRVPSKQHYAKPRARHC